MRATRLLKGLVAGPIMASSGAALLASAAPAVAAKRKAEAPSAGLYPVKRNARYVLDCELTDERLVTTYNNFCEFGGSKSVWRVAKALPIRPWEVRIASMVEKERTIGIDELLKRMPLEERLYRHRCVEAWSMVVPWSGFSLRALVEFARFSVSAKYLRMETFHMPSIAGR